jgi:hypothetical protein
VRVVQPANPPASEEVQMSDQPKSSKPDFAAQMARAEFGRHYVDSGRIEQVLKRGEIVFQHKAPGQRGGTG